MLICSMMYAFGFDPRRRTSAAPRLSLAPAEANAIAQFFLVPRHLVPEKLANPTYAVPLGIIYGRIVAFAEKHGKWHIFSSHFTSDEIALFEDLAADRAKCQAESDLAYAARARNEEDAGGREVYEDDQAEDADEE
jgi:hypothetical protein